eukprot:g47162.t1
MDAVAKSNIDLQRYLTARWGLGVLLSVSASLFGTFGKIALKGVHNLSSRMAALSPCDPARHRLQVQWYTGLSFAFVSILVVNPVCELSSFLFASQSLLVPFASLGIVWNVLFAPIVLGERLSQRDVLGTCMIMLGCTVVACSGNHGKQAYSFAFCLTRFQSTDFLIYLGCMITTTACMAIIILTCQKPDPWHRVSCGCIGGVVGGNFFLVKCTALLFEISAYDGSIWRDWRAYAIFAATAVATVGGLVLLNFALRQYPAVDVVPLYQSFLIIAGSASGAAFFKDWGHF